MAVGADGYSGTHSATLPGEREGTLMANPSLGIMGQIRPELNRLPSKDLQDRDLELPKNVLKRIEGDILLSLLKSLQGAATQTGFPGEIPKRHLPTSVSEEFPELLS